ncbi:hypothetical protein Vafri_1978 [Volvox africanus]|nr:hypothetical protein Vafri_1978 [Volvox africanus]
MDSSRTSTQHHPPSPGLAGKMVQNARNTHAPSTWRQYDPAIRGFVAYCARHRLPPPGTGAHGRRLLSKVEEAREHHIISSKLVEHTIAAILVLDQLASLPSPCASPVCSAV